MNEWVQPTKSSTVHSNTNMENQERWWASSKIIHPILRTANKNDLQELPEEEFKGMFISMLKQLKEALPILAESINNEVKEIEFN